MQKFDWVAAILGMIGVACVFSGGIGLFYIAPAHFDGYGDGIPSQPSPHGLLVVVAGLVALVLSWVAHNRAKRER